jgi:glycosyltransferase involved in cell wall biosynthesis
LKHVAEHCSVVVIADGMPAGGTERQIVSLLRGLSLNFPGIHTHFGVLKKGGAREQEAYHWATQRFAVPQTHELDLTMAWSLTRYAKRNQIDIIHTFGTVADISGVIAARLSGAKLINGSIRSARRRLTRRDVLSRLTMRFADHVVANSKAGVSAFGQRDNPRATVIYNGIDLADYVEVVPYHSDNPYLCMVGNFTVKKDHRALLEAFALVLRSYPAYRLVLVGQGPTEALCRAFIEEHGLSGHVDIITNCHDPAPYIKGADVCILLSPDGEGVSNVILEYCALEKPVVATNKGGTPEVIEHGKSGILVDSHFPVEVEGAIIALLADPAKQARLAARAHKVVAEKFNCTRMVQNYARLYQQLCP